MELTVGEGHSGEAFFCSLFNGYFISGLRIMNAK